MNETEIMEVLQAAYSNQVATFAVFLTMISGYLVLAYMIGNKLDRTQIVIVNSLFLIFATLNVMTSFSFVNVADIYLVELIAVNPERERLYAPEFKWIVAGVHVLVIGACLKFMYDIRKKKT